MSGQLYWKYTDASSFSSCNANIVSIHAAYRITVNSGTNLQINANTYHSPSFTRNTWYHLGFVYDQAANPQIHNIFHEYVWYDPSVFPTIADFPFEFKFGASCGGLSLKLFKIHKHLYSASLVSLMRRDDLYIEFVLVYFEFGEYGSPFFTESITGNHFQMDGS